MKKIIFLTLFSFFATTLIQAQPTNRGLGLVEDNEAYDKIERVANFVGSKFTNLPLKINLKKYCPQVANQGEIGSCVGWSSSYGALTIMAAQQQNWETKETITQNAYSSLYIYNQIKIANCYSGAKISDAMKLMKNQGTCYSESFDNPTEACDRPPSETLHEEAKRNRIQDYFVLFDRNERKKSKIFKTKKSLADGKPVILGMKVRQNFLDLPHGQDTWKPMEGDSTPIGGHAMVIVGYHDGKRAFEVMNSWGDEWGNDGFAWIPYDDFANHAVYGYQILLYDAVPSEPESNEVSTTTIPEAVQSMEDVGPTLQGEFVFQYPIFSESDDIEFEVAKPLYMDNYYVLEKKDWEIGQLFQLIAKNIKKDSYVYVFSVDAKKGVHVHFPQNRKFEPEAFKMMNQSAIVPFEDAEIVIPNEEEALAKEYIGTDYLCVLYSTEEINDLKDIIQKTVSGSGEFVDALNAALGDRAFSKDDINYSINRISCEAYNNSGSIIPIVLEVEGQ